METLEALAGELHLAADELPLDFFERMRACPDDCRTCRYCRDLVRRTVRALPPGLADFCHQRRRASADRILP